MPKGINALRIIFCAGIGWLLCLVEASAAAIPLSVDASAPSFERVLYLGGLLAVLGPLFLWHRWRFVSGKATATCERIVLSRNALVPQFMEWLKSRAVQQLVLQRQELLSTQQLAEMELGKLETMLTAAHAPLQQRVREYEQRIGELEEALEARGVQSGELIESMIRLTRQKLEAECDSR
jgi:hypothetical protein